MGRMEGWGINWQGIMRPGEHPPGAHLRSCGGPMSAVPATGGMQRLALAGPNDLNRYIARRPSAQPRHQTPWPRDLLHARRRDEHSIYCAMVAAISSILLDPACYENGNGREQTSTLKPKMAAEDEELTCHRVCGAHSPRT